MIDIPILRKSLALGFILIIFGNCIAPSIAQNMDKISGFSSTGNWLYVGGIGSGNYSSIQDAINDSEDGDTVYVYHYNSPYQENVIVDKAINLLGEDKDSTVIDSGSVTIQIIEDNVRVSGFTILNSQWIYDIHRAGIYILSNNTTISDNIITNVWEGIDCGWFDRSVDNIIVENNKIDFVKGQGLSFLNTKFCAFSNNTINNTFSNGINLNNASGNCISQNFIQNISGGCGIQLQYTSGCQILSNIIKNGEMDAIFLVDSNNAFVSTNIIESMGENGISSTNSIVIANNNVDSCGNYGIFVFGDNCIITGNRVTKNRIGIFLSQGNNCVIKSNIIKQNDNGLNLEGVSYSTVSKNSFMNNKNDANFTSLITNIIGVFTCFGTRFKENYWGRTQILPKIIPGIIYFTKDGENFTHLYSFKIDKHPAKAPFDIKEII